MKPRTFTLASLASVALLSGAALAQPRLDEEHQRLAQEVAAKAIEFMRAKQDAESGGWSVAPPGRQLPAITALVVNGLRLNGMPNDDPAVRRGVEFLLAHRKPDGGIYDTLLPSYNTACALSALAGIDDPNAIAAIEPAQRFLVSLQWSEESGDDPTVARVGPDNPFYGGIGYGQHGRPDLSNLGLALQGLKDSGLDQDSPAFKRATVFLSRLQMVDEINDMPYADGSEQGGFIYATGPDAAHPTIGESKAGEIVETLPDGTKVSRLRAYGSMTYTGFKSYVYAGLPRDDERVQAALNWLRRHYSLDENPGLGQEGLYYYYVVMARALDAWDEPAIQVTTEDGREESRRWAEDLVRKLASLQQPDGSFRPIAARWMEGDPELITAYALIALGAARGGPVN
ncbi:MAG TPA: prenyltransferase/squalene oxidase repeat-containing protein [Phycisphaerales bacterium]|nr:prenyltransferase/squalene oxidase repeat-containing protein [Phycisphaerales bacterium]